MASSTTTKTIEVMQQFVDQEVTKEAKNALSENTGFWAGIEKFINWLRTKVANFFSVHMQNIPLVGRWASRISVSVSELMFTVVQTLIGLLRTVFGSRKVWSKAHEAAMMAWNDNESSGLLAQIYAYAKKMAGYFLEIIKQCLERAIAAHGLEVTAEEKKEINNLLDDIGL